jgi:transcriptional regulator with XRE-family HTH domain
MAKKPEKHVTEAAAGSRERSHSLGQFLTDIRTVKKLTLREVEEATNKEVSNAYLSQLETGKISKPSPNVLHSLATVYGVAYETLMEKAGYFSPSSVSESSTSSQGQRHGRAATFANENLSADEESQLLEYLAFLRTRRNHGEKS